MRRLSLGSRLKLVTADLMRPTISCDEASPGSVSGLPYINSAEDMFESSLG
jgi:hypothetical protein